MRTDQIKAIYHGLIDQKVYEFIAKKVSNLNGDIRAAFDMMRNAVSLFAEEVKDEMPTTVRITINHALKLYEKKQTSKIGEIFQKLPNQKIIILHAAVVLFENEGEEKIVSLSSLFEETEIECSVREAQKIDMRNFSNCIDELE